MFQRALVPLDGTELAEGILPYVTQLTKGLGMELVLLAVVEPDAVEIPARMGRTDSGETSGHLETIGLGGPVMVGSESVTPTLVREAGEPHAMQLFDRAESAARSRLLEVAKQLEIDGVQVQAEIAIGKPAEQIVEGARRYDCDLIAMSTHGRNALGRGVLGSVTDKVIHASNLPVLTVAPGRAQDYTAEGVRMSKVMVALDGSELAETALPYATQLATGLSLKPLLVRVVDTGGPYTGFLDDARFVDILPEFREDASAYLEEVAGRLAEQGVEAEWKVLDGSPARSIVDEARAMPNDLIVITSHGRTGFTRWWLGSVSEALVRASGDPVLVIPPEGAD